MVDVINDNRDLIESLCQKFYVAWLEDIRDSAEYIISATQQKNLDAYVAMVTDYQIESFPAAPIGDQAI